MNEKPRPEAIADDYLTVHQVAQYLHLNEKSIYALIKEGGIPATKVTGKWLFPRKLIDEWLLESSHGGVLTDRLIVTGSDDPLLATAIAFLAAEIGEEALVAYSPTGTRGGLDLLAKQRANVCAIHWGPEELSDRRHPRLIKAYPGHVDWTIVRMAQRRQGVIVRAELGDHIDLAKLAGPDTRWVMRQAGSGSQHFLETMLLKEQLIIGDRQIVTAALSERHAASLVAQGKADCAPGAQSAAGEFGLKFLPLGWECFDLVLPQGVFFRRLFQQLMAELGSERMRGIAAGLQGYDLAPLGKVLSIPSD